MKREFVLTKMFESEWAKLGLTHEDLQKLESSLIKFPGASAVIPELAGAKKLRIALGNREESNGVRVIHLDVFSKEKSYLLKVYPKTVQSDMSRNEKKDIHSIVEMLKEV